MSQHASTVDEYMTALPADRQAAIERLRNLCQASLPSFEETMVDNKPSYCKDGECKAAFASQAHHIAFFVKEPAVIANYEAHFSDPHDGMLQFNKADAVDFELIEKLLHDVGALNKR